MTQMATKDLLEITVIIGLLLLTHSFIVYLGAKNTFKEEEDRLHGVIQTTESLFLSLSYLVLSTSSTPQGSILKNLANRDFDKLLLSIHRAPLKNEFEHFGSSFIKIAWRLNECMEKADHCLDFLGPISFKHLFFIADFGALKITHRDATNLSINVRALEKEVEALSQEVSKIKPK